MINEENIEQLSQLRTPLLQFARLHLADQAEAEDCVQEVLLAYWSKPAQYQGKAALKTYLFAILKHKIVDSLRLKYKNKIQSEDGICTDFDIWFQEDGNWVPQEQMYSWSEPDADLQTQQFFQVIDHCIKNLPQKTAAVFSMKELMELESDEICQILGVSKDLYWQCMSRARKSMQTCLSLRWFNQEVQREVY
jgi:RNA polymerase sigma-70 factor (ECF subfamily)